MSTVSALLLTICWSAASNPATQPWVELRPHFRQGQVFTYQIVKERLSNEPGLSSRQRPITLTVTFSVVDASDEAILLRIQPLKLDIDMVDLPGVRDSTLWKEIERAARLPIDIELASDGRTIRVGNREAIQERCLELMAAFSADVGTRGADRQSSSALWRSAQWICGDEDYAERSAAGAYAAFFAVFGRRITAEPSVEEIVGTLKSGTQPIRMRLQTRLKNGDAESVTLEMRQTCDRESFRRSLEGWMTTVFSVVPQKATATLPSCDFLETGEFVVQRENGLLLSAEQATTVLVGQTWFHQETSWRLIEPAPSTAPAPTTRPVDH